MTSSVQSHLPSDRCLYERQCPLQEHFFLEDLEVVAKGERPGWSHACTYRRESGPDVSGDARQSVEASEFAVLSVEASAHAVLNVEASANVPVWDISAASRVATRSANCTQNGASSTTLR